MNIDQAYKMLSVSPEASDEDVVRSYKRLAMQFHPDRNRDRMQWANETMARLNNAYSEVMSFRFRRSGQENNGSDFSDEERFRDFKDHPDDTEKKSDRKKSGPEPKPDPDELIDRFARVRHSSNSSLYKFFQYNLYNMARREKPSNQGIFNRIVKTLRRGYHACLHFDELTDDPELKEHFSVFREMLYHFYLASECVNIIDSYSNGYDVDAYREYRKGEDYLHLAHKEIFYDRHNRGFFKGAYAMNELHKAESVLSRALSRYENSTWSVETGIKLDYVRALKDYLNLFFTE